MGATEWTLVAVSFLGIIVGLIGWLLASRDAKQQKEMDEMGKAVKLLFEKHDEDEQQLTDFRLEIARNHYPKSELDPKFEQLRVVMSDGFRDLGSRFDKFFDKFMEYVNKTNKNGNESH